MSHEVALESALPDVTGTRWARAERDGRVYLAARMPDGREIVERKGGEPWHPAQRLRRPPRGLVWTALRVYGASEDSGGQPP